jgi:hypothetical protein
MTWLRINDLCGFKRLTLKQVACIYFDLTFFNSDREQIQRTRGWRILNCALLVEL